MNKVQDFIYKLCGFAKNKCDMAGVAKHIAFVRFTNKCPNKCSFCIDRYTPNSTMLSAEELAEICLNRTETDIYIGGGEPMIDMERLHKFVNILYGKKRMHMNTSLPFTAFARKDLAYDIFSKIDIIDISMHGNNNDDDKKVFKCDYHYDKISFIKELNKQYPGKIVLSCILMKSKYKSFDDIRCRISTFKKIGISKFYLNEISTSMSFKVDPEYVSINDLLKASKLPMMKSAFCYGCHVSLNYLFNDPDIDVHLKRICYRTGGTENPSIMDLLKEVCHILFRNAKNGDLQIYEDGSITRYRKQDIKKIRGKLL